MEYLLLPMKHCYNTIAWLYNTIALLYNTITVVQHNSFVIQYNSFVVQYNSFIIQYNSFGVNCTSITVPDGCETGIQHEITSDAFSFTINYGSIINGANPGFRSYVWQ